MFSTSIDPNDFLTLSSDSAMIQAAVDEAAKTGSAVVIPRVNKRTGKAIWNISEAIKLYTGSAVYLDNCHLRLADGVFCNIFINSHLYTEKALDIKGRQFDIRISGFGNAVLDGGEYNGCNAPERQAKWWQNSGIHFGNAERVVVENLRMINQRFWALTYHYCAYGRVSNIDFECVEKDRCLDGIDLRSGCHDFIIENLSGKVGDDMVALTNLPDADKSFGVIDGLSKDIHSVIIRNIKAKYTAQAAIIRLLNQGPGRQLYNILIDGIMDSTVNTPGDEWFWNKPAAAVLIGDTVVYGEKPALGDIRGITVRNVITRARFGILDRETLQDALIEGIQLYDGAGPAACFVNSHAQNITLRDIQYGADSRLSETERDYLGGFVSGSKLEKFSAVHFHNTKCDSLRIYNLTMGNGFDAVFSGVESQVNLDITGLYNASGLPLVCGEGINVFGNR